MQHAKVVLHRLDHSEGDQVVDTTGKNRVEIKAVVRKMFNEHDPKLYTVLEVPRVVS